MEDESVSKFHAEEMLNTSLYRWVGMLRRLDQDNRSFCWSKCEDEIKGMLQYELSSFSALVVMGMYIATALTSLKPLLYESPCHHRYSSSAPPTPSRTSNPPKHRSTAKPAQPTAPSQQAKSPLGAAQTQHPPPYPQDSVPASSCDLRRAQRGGGRVNCPSRSTESRIQGRKGTYCSAYSQLQSPPPCQQPLRACGRSSRAGDRRRNPRASESADYTNGSPQNCECHAGCARRVWRTTHRELGSREYRLERFRGMSGRKGRGWSRLRGVRRPIRRPSCGCRRCRCRLC